MSGGESSILIDNSTYFSTKVLLDSRELDAKTIYNLANFLESLVLTDRIRLAPTANWQPDSTDSILFGPEKPCEQIALSAFTETNLGHLFGNAVKAGLLDCQNNQLTALLPHVDANFGETRNILLSWLPQISRSPLDFVEVYSGKVLTNDPNAARFLASLPETETEGASDSRRLAQYLLRTNVALELSESVPYHPHSHRVEFVSEKFLTLAERSVSLNLDLLR